MIAFVDRTALFEVDIVTTKEKIQAEKAGSQAA
jgi:hypothetical protein